MDGLSVYNIIGYLIVLIFMVAGIIIVSVMTNAPNKPEEWQKKWTSEKKEEWLNRKRRWDNLSVDEREGYREREGRELPYGEVNACESKYSGPPYPWEDKYHPANKNMVMIAPSGDHRVIFIDREPGADESSTDCFI